MIVVATDREGVVHELSAATGTVLMELLRDEGLGVEAVCGGCCACATCHVHVDLAEVGPRGEVEQELLLASAFYREMQSRLSCQIALTEQHNELAVTIAPEE